MQTCPDKPVAVTIEDISNFVACILYMSIVKLPSTRDYWSPSTGIPYVAEMMSVNQFEQIKHFLHFANNTTANKEDKTLQDKTHI